MSDDKEALTRERIELEQQYRAHVARHGFSYREYIAPSPGSFTDRYKRRTAEIDAVLAPELKDPDDQSEG